MRWLVIAVVLAFPALARAEVRLGVMAAGWIDASPLFGVTVEGATPLLRHLELGGRGGATFLTEASRAMVPLDLQLRGLIGRAYLDASVGPWILFDDHPVRAHASVGVGVRAGILAAGVELGYLQDSAIVGLNVSLRL